MASFKQKYWGKMARREWLLNGGRNSLFFFFISPWRQERQEAFKDSSGVWVEDPAQIERMFIIDFSARFKSTQVNSPNIDMEMLNLVSAEDNNRLLQAIHDSKFNEAIFQMDKFKGPGPGGFAAAAFF